MSRLPRTTWLYFTAQSINLTAAVMSVTMAATVGAALAPTPALSTVPYGFQFLLLMLATYPASWLMSRLGRKRSFLLGCVPLALAGISGYLAVVQQSFGLLITSHAALGIYVAFANFNRFAATDNLEPGLKPKAISLVVAGGVIAAVVGPTLTQVLREAGAYQAFSLCYAAFIGLAIFAALVTLCLPETPAPVAKPSLARASLLSLPSAPIMLAMAVAALSYFIMNLLMIQASLHMQHMHEDFTAMRLAIQWHVIAMFAPSFFTGVIIERLGLRTTLCLGLLMLAGCALLNMIAHGYWAMSSALIILGLGWNLTYVGGGALLAQLLEGHGQTFKVQGQNDLLIAIFATAGAFAPALLLSSLGWQGSNLLCVVLALVLLVATVKVVKGRGVSPASMA
ncbi:major facilitator superfamily transporter [Pseudomonas sp. StFLB209]|uniref:MFS transporter n=1 Tax=Pseudomonas sp. StFLB209 TaxID=1028989 RepID=UPI0004F6D380|nr:MFS transporter [Pseudomonas sp. StFLB209]BAP42096.1 major facilitator superfamily transporter [Pseudomonas sp. StFLB209]